MFVKYNYDKLKGLIREKFKTQDNFAKDMKMAPNTLSSKLNNQTDFTSTEISTAVELLDVKTAEEAWYIFFTKEVE